MDIGLFFGSFNPIHIGHLIIANTMAEYADLDQVWFVVSPQNPHKKSNSLLHEFDRMQMVRLAISDNAKFHATDIEFRMPRPSYTVDTLTYLSEKYPKHKFNLILGEDNLKNFPKWKNHQVILDNYGLLVYPRPGSEKTEVSSLPQVKMIDAPKVDISATFIRNAIKQNKSIRYLVHEEAIDYINSKNLYH
ncbi:nicotinate (nicotinamide) nucleotide adenylyltransferase [Flammeovirgaceae bacterium SG7u.111]|nr:nicotinate (nicotinamide) nucleotide adenylyltransferase [Flammeovirgaceae bacterium SG7u.132]WPO35775.1 nicotinate (nicotinamide) nucleotide adenylyltransferase [Flammeovirgaceae bacterium SG7u.111]